MDAAKKPYRAVTRQIEVQVRPQFLPERSSPENGYYFWAYHITLTNLGRETVQLKTRHWRITDAHGRLQEVRGAGVVGEEPVLKPGENFEYTSGVPLPTSSGFMTGTYGMVSATGDEFEIEIPACFFRHRSTVIRSLLGWLLRAQLGGFEPVGCATEFAGNRDLALLHHVITIFLRKALQHLLDTRARTRALRMQIPAAENAHAALVKQPVQ
jgi:ApaG protein